MEFEWDPAKNEANLHKHGISFEDAALIFRQPVLFAPAASVGGEERYIALGELRGKCWAVVFTMRDGAIRIISARRARKNEERRYREVFP